MQLRNAFLAATVMALPLAALPVAAQAQSQPITGLYVGAGAGVNFMQDEPIRNAGPLSFSNVNLNTDVGAVGVLSGGWGFGNGLRVELDLSYYYNPLSSVTVNGNSGSALGGKISGNEQKIGLMPTVMYDFTTLSPVVVPYVGAGIGYTWVMEKINADGEVNSKTQGAFCVPGYPRCSLPDRLGPGPVGHGRISVPGRDRSQL